MNENNVKLISVTPDAEKHMAYCARVSNPSNQMNKETNERLIKYLIKHQHWSPLEMVSACLEIQTTRDIAHQIVRHRSLVFRSLANVMLIQMSRAICLNTVKQDFRTKRIDKTVLKLMMKNYNLIGYTH